MEGLTEKPCTTPRGVGVEGKNTAVAAYLTAVAHVFGIIEGSHLKKVAQFAASFSHAYNQHPRGHGVQGTAVPNLDLDTAAVVENR